jgi:hypothetical protein
MTKAVVRSAVVAAIALALATVISAQQKTDITGAWTFDVKTDAGGGTPTVTFKQDGEKITGHYSSTNLGEADLTGTVKGKDIAFAFDGQVQGQTVPVTYNGTIDTPTTMSGRLSIGGAVGGTFTGKKK